MQETVIACEMLRDELELAIARTGAAPEVVWMDKGLHETPDVLRRVLQDRLDQLPDTCGRVLLAMAYCGGALNGVTSRRAVVVAPRFDDCVRMLLAVEPGQRSPADSRSLYVTRQWLLSDRYILRDYERYQRTYGEKRVARIMAAMLSSYRSLRLVDTGAYDLSAYESGAAADAARLGLGYSRQAGTVRVLEKLLLHQFDSEFCGVQPGETLTLQDFLPVYGKQQNS